jgi:hypothetical protein
LKGHRNPSNQFYANPQLKKYVYDAPQKIEERRLSLMSDGNTPGVAPGVFAFVEVWTKWREAGRPELADWVEVLKTPPLFLMEHPKWPSVMEAFVAEWRVMGKYSALAQAALKGFKRHGTFQEKMAQLVARQPGKDAAWYEAQIAHALTDWEPLSEAERQILFEFMLDPECEPMSCKPLSPDDIASD